MSNIYITVIGNKYGMVVQVHCMNDLELLLTIIVDNLFYMNH